MARDRAEEPSFVNARMPQMSEQEFKSEMGGDGEDDDIMFMSMADFKKKLDMMSSRKWLNLYK